VRVQHRRQVIKIESAERMKEKIVNFFQDIVKEMKKVTWPTREELTESTKIVVLVSLFIATFTWVVDLAVSEILKLILRS
jgi:preprotein translocase subunit SecE